MTPDAFCLTRCKGACCALHHGDGTRSRCPRQAPGGSCTVYRERFAAGQPETVRVGWYRREPGGPLRPFWCTRIGAALARGTLPEPVRRRCCYAHPSLLEEKTNAQGDL